MANTYCIVFGQKYGYKRLDNGVFRVYPPKGSKPFHIRCQPIKLANEIKNRVKVRNNSLDPFDVMTTFKGRCCRKKQKSDGGMVLGALISKEDEKLIKSLNSYYR